MPYSVTTKNAMLDLFAFDRIRLHSADPGAAGTTSIVQVSGVDQALQTAVFNAAGSSARALNAAVACTGLLANQSVTHFSVWTAAGSVFRGSGTISSGDVTANAAGAYTLAVGTTCTLT